MRGMELELGNLKTKKASMFMNIPAKQLKIKATDVIVEPLKHIWNNESVDNKKFPTKIC